MIDHFPPEKRVQWKNQYRIISTKYPPVHIFDGLCPPELLKDLVALEARTNPRIMQQVGDLSLVNEHDIITGNGAGIVMTAFTHIGFPSRFSDGSFGVYYAAQKRETAIHETVFHRERIARDAGLEPDFWHMRIFIGEILKNLVDIRYDKYQHLHDPDVNNYPISQVFGKAAKQNNYWGIVYNSVRHKGGQCIAALRPPAVSIPKQDALLEYVWDGNKIISVCEKSDPIVTFS